MAYRRWITTLTVVGLSMGVTAAYAATPDTKSPWLARAFANTSHSVLEAISRTVTDRFPDVVRDIVDEKLTPQQIEQLKRQWADIGKEQSELTPRGRVDHLARTMPLRTLGILGLAKGLDLGMKVPALRLKVTRAVFRNTWAQQRHFLVRDLRRNPK
jgi:hypothetical protein